MMDSQHPHTPPPAQTPQLYGAAQTQVYVGYPPAPPRGLSVASMVLGIVSIFFGFTFVVPLTGLILGIAGFRREVAGRGMAIAGLIMNGLVLLGVVAVGLFFLLGFAGILGAGFLGTGR